MSKVAITGNASGTGTFTIAAPNSNTNRTLTLPDNTGTILTNATTAGFPAGSVLQVVQATSTTYHVTSSNTYQATNLTASITPSSNSNKILVLIQTQLGMSQLNWTDIGLFRGATALYGSTANSGAFDGTSTDSHAPGVIVYLDSPNTTSSTTYTMYFRGRQSLQARVILDSMLSTITLMEIAA